MSRISAYPEETNPAAKCFTFVAVDQNDGTFITKKMDRDLFVGGGPQGPQGPQGEPGSAGPAGANGTNGTNGTNGADGAKGDKGDKGDTGNTGATGATGPAGPTKSEFGTDDGWCFEFFEEYNTGAISAPDQGIGWSAAGVVSNGTIVSKNIPNSKTEKRLQLSNGEYGRKFFFGSEWHRLQIVVLWSFTGNATFTGDGAIGLCSGTANMEGSGSTDNFIGIHFDETTPNSWAYTAGTAQSHYFQSTSTRWKTKRGGANTDQGGGAGSDGRRFAGTEAYRSMLFLEVSRPVAATSATSVNYAWGMASTNSVRADFSLSKRAVYDVLMDAFSSTMAASNNVNLICQATAVTNTFAFDESTGAFDTLNIRWTPTSNKMEIAAIGVRKLY